jgi:hypothetical protein
MLLTSKFVRAVGWVTGNLWQISKDGGFGIPTELALRYRIVRLREKALASSFPPNLTSYAPSILEIGQ